MRVGTANTRSLKRSCTRLLSTIVYGSTKPNSSPMQTQNGMRIQGQTALKIERRRVMKSK
jgi:hypothetical protein